MQPKLTLVGAGPGDPDLISLKGIRALADADVVLYDALVAPSLLDFAPVKSIKVFVGKRSGKHHMSQQTINELIVSYALSHGHVVRLKGGDPFIFGRGQEEIEYARNFRVSTAVVPGISSATALPGLQGIPLTHRHINQSFWVMTATTSGGELARDLRKAMETNATLVILMGMKKLPQICSTFFEMGQSDLPVAVIQNGSMPNEKTVTGCMHNICDKVAENGLGTPAIIVIGEVVRLHQAFREEMVEKKVSNYKFTA